MIHAEPTARQKAENRKRKRGCDTHPSWACLLRLMRARVTLPGATEVTISGRKDWNFPSLKGEAGQETEARLAGSREEGCFSISMLFKSDTFSSEILRSCDNNMEVTEQEGWQPCSSLPHQTESLPSTPACSLSWNLSCVLKGIENSGKKAFSIEHKGKGPLPLWQSRRSVSFQELVAVSQEIYFPGINLVRSLLLLLYK